MISSSSSTSKTSPRFLEEISNNTQNKTTISKAITNKPINPFEDEDDINYDESKNPFAAEDTDHKNTAAAGNPFEEYDNNLNPFA